MSTEIPQLGEEVGDYVDSDNFERNVHIDNDGNFSENIGSRSIRTVPATTGPYASLPTKTFILKKLSNHVDLQIPDILDNANTTSTTAITFPAVIPAHDRPRADKYFPVVLVGNAAPMAGYLRVVAASGNLVFQVMTGNQWTNTAQAGVRGIDVGWDCKF